MDDGTENPEQKPSFSTQITTYPTHPRFSRKKFKTHHQKPQKKKKQKNQKKKTKLFNKRTRPRTPIGATMLRGTHQSGRISGTIRVP